MGILRAPGETEGGGHPPAGIRQLSACLDIVANHKSLPLLSTRPPMVTSAPLPRYFVERRSRTAPGLTDPLPQTVAAGVKATGAEVTILQFPEILSDDVLAKMYGSPLNASFSMRALTRLRSQARRSQGGLREARSITEETND